MGKEFAIDVLALDEETFLAKYGKVPYLDFKERVRLALLEQDRDTRHAITDALATSGCISDQAERDRACSIVMNCTQGVQF